MRRACWSLLALALGAAALGVGACHEQFESVPSPDLAKRPETFGFDLAVAIPPEDLGIDMSGKEHDLAKLDAN